MSRPFPPGWQEVLRRDLFCYRCLPAAAQRELQGLVQVLLAEKHFEGCGGLEVTEAMRLLIAAQACLLLVGREPGFYPGLESILVYPRTYVAHLARRQPDGTVWEGPQARHGESWTHGSLVLTWEAVLRGATDPHDARNVVLHEFAHQLDAQSGAMEGAPRLPSPDRYRAWERVLQREYQALNDRLERGQPTWLDPYAATDPAEFFAVASEAYFKKPHELKGWHPELFEQLRLYYRFDPSRLDPTCLQGGLLHA